MAIDISPEAELSARCAVTAERVSPSAAEIFPGTGPPPAPPTDGPSCPALTRGRGIEPFHRPGGGGANLFAANARRLSGLSCFFASSKSIMSSLTRNWGWTPESGRTGRRLSTSRCAEPLPVKGGSGLQRVSGRVKNCVFDGVGMVRAVFDRREIGLPRSS